MEAIPWDARSFFPDPEEQAVLARIAALPGNYKQGKRARFLLMYTKGIPKDGILEELAVSEQSLARWWTRWIEDGLDGLIWLHDTRLSFLHGLDPNLQTNIRAAVQRVRMIGIPAREAALDGDPNGLGEG